MSEKNNRANAGEASTSPEGVNEEQLNQADDGIPTEEDYVKAFKYEVKEILQGHIIRNDNNMLEVYDDTMAHISTGLYEESLKLKILGASAKTRRYVQSSNPAATEKKVREALADMGRATYLYTKPDTICYLITSFWLSSGLLMFYFEGKVPVAKVYTARGLFSFVSRRYYLKKLEKLAGDTLMREVKQKKEKDQGKNQDKKEKPKKEQDSKRQK